jgi:predicted amidohydrolase YtcJ
MTGRVLLRCSLFALAILPLAACAAAPQEEPADLVLRNGRIVTVDSAQPEVQALAVAGSRIVALGTDEAIARFVGPDTRVIDLEGRLAVPGFIEGHGHFMGLGEAKLSLDLTRVRSWDEIVAMVAAAARDAGADTWIVGRGWHQEKWDRVPEPNVEGVPLHASLDSVSPRNPVLLEHASGHATFANGRALELAGVTRATPDPAGGEIVKDASGEPTGLLREEASGLVSRPMYAAQSRMSAADREGLRRRMVELAGAEALSKGVTGFVDAGVSFGTVDFYRTLETEGALPVRLYVMLSGSPAELAEKLAAYRMPADTNDFLVVRSIKRSIDGALGSHGAWLLEPYADMPASTGLATDDPADIARVAQLALEHGYQLGVHAIGDRANREVLDIYQAALAGHADAGDVRWRIEHAQHLHPDDVKRFAPLGVIAAMQGVHATSDGPWIPRRLGGERARTGAYVWRDLLESGVRIANGTDVPVEAIDPIASYYSSVSRRMSNGEVFYPAQRMTRAEALRSYTLDNAFATFAEAQQGSLTVGKLADIAVLSQDILAVAEDRIPATVVDFTIVGGVVRYERAPAAR